MDVRRRIAPQAWMIEPETRAVLAALAASGRSPLFVGGCVRDALLDRPIKDVDLATPDPPPTVADLLGRAGIKVVPTGIAHGTVTAVIGERHFEITTLRRDIETDGRRAKVVFTDDWEADAARRDFTINALYLAADGAVFDPTDGLADLAAGRVRFIGDAAERIREDYLRILRFFRFSAWYATGGLDPAGLAACRDAAPAMTALAAERIAAELLRLLAAPNPTPIVARMIADGVFMPILPTITNAARLTRLVEIETALDAADPTRRLAALCADRAAARTIAARLRLSRAAAERVVTATEARPDDQSVAGLQAAAYRDGAEAVRDRLLWTAAGAATLDLPSLRNQLTILAAWTRPAFPVKGSDLIARGISRGPEVGRLMTVLEDWWIEQTFAPTREDILARLDAIVLAER